MIDKIIGMGVELWNDYCHRNHPTVRNVGAHAAAPDYLIQHMREEYPTFTKGKHC